MAAEPGYEVPSGATLPGLLRDRYAAQPGDPAVHVDGGRLSFDALGRHVFRTAHALAAAGVRAGDRVGALLPNGRAFVGVWLACAELGATLVPVNVNLTGDTLRYIVEHAGLHTLVLDRSVFPAYATAFGETAPARTLLTVGGDLPGARRLEALLAAAEERPPPLLGVERAAPALIIYTSGTTGRPKGVVLSRAAQLAHGWYYGKDFVRLGPGETSYTCLPLFHVTSMGFTLGTLFGGAAVAIDAQFNPFSFWQRIRRFDARIFPFLGAMIGMLSARPERPDDATVPAQRAIGAATPVHLWEAFERRFCLRLIETYGQTELASLWLMPPAAEGKVGTVGAPAPRFDALITGDDGHGGRFAQPAAPGELLIRAHDPLLMFQEYFRDPEATGAALGSLHATGNVGTALLGGWYATGDVMSLDEDGFFRFEGRLKEFIRRRGENVSAFEVERAALSHPAVREAAAVGVPSSLGEEEIKLCVLASAPQSVDPAALYRHLQGRLAGFMLPRYIEVYPEFPRTATQRVQKYRLVEDGVRATTWDRRERGERRERKEGNDRRRPRG